MNRLFRWVPRSGWKRYLVLTFLVFFSFIVVLAGTGYLLFQIPTVQMFLFSKIVNHQLQQEIRRPPRPSLGASDLISLTAVASSETSADMLFDTTNVWPVHLKFTAGQWSGLGPKAVPPIPVSKIFKSDGTSIMRNPAASRAGVAGVLGIDMVWSKATLEFGSLVFTNIEARFKGNGSFLMSIINYGGYKRPFKVDLNDHEKSYHVGGRTKLNFANLLMDDSLLSEAMAYEFFREAGIPAPRTAFARLLLTVEGRFEKRLLGLYGMTENPDKEWAREEFGVKGIALFKPVTRELFNDLGEDWAAYEAIYDPKNKITQEQERRLIQLARLVTHASDDDFDATIADLIDLDKFATFMAGQVIISNYDSILDSGQNFLIYHDPRTDKFGFIPWDLDHSWGEFPMIATADERERASIWHPWVGRNRFLERMFKLDLFKERYQREIERLLENQFIPEQLSHRLDELASVVRPFIREESSFRRDRFNRAVADSWGEGARGGNPFYPNRPVYPLKLFFQTRAESVRGQLAGEEEGVILTRTH